MRHGVDLQMIQRKIYEIRGQRVMLDFDLAELYGIETKYLKRSVKNNIRRFPSDFMFELTKEEFDSLRCNFSTSKRGGIRYMPFAFSEHGVAQLSAVLNSDIAIEVNIQIIRTFVAMRQWITTPPIDKNAELREEMKKLKEYMEEVFCRPERHQRRYPDTNRTDKPDPCRVAGAQQRARKETPSANRIHKVRRMTQNPRPFVSPNR